MIDHLKALELVLNQKKNVHTQDVALHECLGFILAESVVADRDFPPFNRVAMDGIAVSSSSLNQGSNRLKILDSIAAGAAFEDTFNAEDCVEIMTGAVLPSVYDRVIPYEQIEIVDGYAEIQWSVSDLMPKRNIHYKGYDQKRGDVLCTKGEKIDMGRIAVMASVGMDFVKVYSPLKIAVISTGNELVEVREKPNDFQIRRSNSIMIKTELSKAGHSVEDFHLQDNFALLKREIQSLIHGYDILIFSGGVSMGKYDYLPEVFKDLGVERFFHKVAQRPGKPFWFGRKNECLFFGLPGNPVSSFVCYKIYVKAWLDNHYGMKVKCYQARMSEALDFKPDLHLLKVSELEIKNGEQWIRPKKQSGSGDLSSLINVDAILSLDRGVNHVKQGALVEFYKV